MFMIQIKEFAFINMLTCDMLLTDARLSDLFIKMFIFIYITITDVNSYNIAS